MAMVIVGVLLLAAKLAEFGPFGKWSWWIVLAPFGIALLWWEFAEHSGWTRRRVMNQMEAKKVARRQKAIDDLGLNRGRDRQLTSAIQAKARQVSADPTMVDADPEPRPEPMPMMRPAAPATAPRPTSPVKGKPAEARREPRL
jgi:small Trp-rich protein